MGSRIVLLVSPRESIVELKSFQQPGKHLVGVGVDPQHNGHPYDSYAVIPCFRDPG